MKQISHLSPLFSSLRLTKLTPAINDSYTHTKPNAIFHSLKQTLDIKG